MVTFNRRQKLFALLGLIFWAGAWFGAEYIPDLYAQVINPGTPTVPPTPANGDCAKFVVSSGNVQGITTAGAACQTGASAVTSVSNSDGSLTVTPTVGAVVASLNVAHVNTWAASQNFSNVVVNFTGASSGVQFGSVTTLNVIGSTYTQISSADSTTGGATILAGPHTDPQVYIRGNFTTQDAGGLASYGLIVKGAFPAMGVNGEYGISADPVRGAVYGGQGSGTDFTLVNKTGTKVCSAATGGTTLDCTGLTQNGVAVGPPLATAIGTIDGEIPIYEGIHANAWIGNQSIGRNFYVSPTGSDTNNICNVAASPCQHIQYAVIRATQYGLANPIVNLSSGTFNESVNFGGLGFQPGQVNGNLITVSGNGSANTTWNGASGICGTVIANYAANVDIQNVTLLGTGDPCQSTVYANLDGIINILADVKFGAASNCHIFTEDIAQVQIWNVYTITGGGNCHVAATTLSFVSYNFGAQAITITGTPNFANYFALAAQGGVLDMNQATFSGATTGKKFVEQSHGYISYGGNPNVLFPGSVNGNFSGVPIVGSSGETLLLTNTTNYCGLASCNTSGGTGSAYTSPVAGTLNDLYVYSSGSPGGTATYTITIDVDGTLGALTCQIPAAGSSCNDVTHTTNVAQGSRIFFQVVMSAGAGNSTFSFGSVLRE